MKKLKMLSMLCVVVLVAVLFSGSALAVVPVTLETPEPPETPEGVNLQGHPMVLQLKNNSGDSVTIEPPTEAKVWIPDAGVEYDWAVLDSAWLEFEGEKVLAPGETVKIATIPSGPGWRDFFTTPGATGPGPVGKDVYYVQVKIKVDGYVLETNEATHTRFPFPTAEDGKVDYAWGSEFLGDNGDGTGTFKVIGVSDNGDKPISGLGKNDFTVGGEHLVYPAVPLGTIIGVVETVERYEDIDLACYYLIWHHKDGNYDGMLDLWVCDRPVGLGFDEVSISSSPESKVVQGYTSEEFLDFCEGKVKMSVNSTEGSFALVAELYDEDKGKASPGLVPANLYLNLSRSENIDGDTIRVEIDYDPEELPAGVDAASLKLFRYNEETGSWEKVDKQGVNLAENYIWMEIDSFSTYGVFVEAEEAVNGKDGKELPATGSRALMWMLPLGLLLCLAGAFLIKCRARQQV